MENVDDPDENHDDDHVIGSVNYLAGGIDCSEIVGIDAFRVKNNCLTVQIHWQLAVEIAFDQRHFENRAVVPTTEISKKCCFEKSDLMLEIRWTVDEAFSSSKGIVSAYSAEVAFPAGWHYYQAVGEPLEELEDQIVVSAYHCYSTVGAASPLYHSTYPLAHFYSN